MADCDRFQGRQDSDLAAFDVAELQHLDAGSWFYREDPFEQIAAGRVTSPPASDQHQPIPILAEALKVIADIGVMVNIELKCLSTDADDSLDRVVNDIQAAGLVQGSLVSAFDHSILRQLKVRYPALATAALVEDSHPDMMLDYLADLGVAGYHVHEQLATSSLINTLRDAGLFVGVYTVNDAARKRALLSAGVGAVITDFLDET
ncbi:MAG TPA: hypothetical protein DD979_11715 [Gammaproteobacteria bacterium]|nr:hypothetical protein [Gammaproteobacteria bacterium]